jgi:hypothetical protein
MVMTDKERNLRQGRNAKTVAVAAAFAVHRRRKQRGR